MALLRIGALPEGEVAAMAAFHGQELPRIIAAMAQTRDTLTLVFAPADHGHRAWRAAAVASLARARAPRRINAVASDDEPAIVRAAAYLEGAHGVTGQVLVLDGAGAGPVVSLAR